MTDENNRNKLKKQWRQKLTEIIQRLETARSDIAREDRVDALDAMYYAELKLHDLASDIRSTMPQHKG